MADYEPVIWPGQCFINRITMGHVRPSSSPITPSLPELWSSTHLFQPPFNYSLPPNSSSLPFLHIDLRSPRSDYIHTSIHHFPALSAHTGCCFPLCAFPYLLQQTTRKRI